MSAQISIDSLVVYQGTYPVVDSFYINGSSNGQYLRDATIYPTNDICGTVYVELNFEGCNPAFTTFDTTIMLGYPARRLYIVTKWDTSANCSLPTVPMYTDTLLWDNCTPVAIEELALHKNIQVYPNPTNNVLNILLSKGTAIEHLELYNLQGQLIKQWNNNQSLLELQELPRGVYGLRITSDKGILTKKIVLQ